MANPVPLHWQDAPISDADSDADSEAEAEADQAEDVPERGRQWMMQAEVPERGRCQKKRQRTLRMIHDREKMLI